MSKQILDKREQFTNPKKSKSSLVIGAFSVFLVIVALVFMFGSNKKEDENYFGASIVAERSYVGEFISMTKVEPVIENGQIKIPLGVVDENNIISFEIENDEKLLVPLMAYITPTGRLFVGSSMCEPCRGRTFSLAGETLVCDTCRTTYNVEDHQFISGAKACGEYPPVNMNPKVEDNMITIELDEVLNWRSRS